MGGLCNGAHFVQDFFDRRMWVECRDCVMRVEVEGVIQCEALEGLEPPLRCPALQEHVNYHGIKLYGANKP